MVAELAYGSKLLSLYQITYCRLPGFISIHHDMHCLRLITLTYPDDNSMYSVKVAQFYHSDVFIIKPPHYYLYIYIYIYVQQNDTNSDIRKG